MRIVWEHGLFGRCQCRHSLSSLFQIFNVERHRTSATLIGTIVRRLNSTRRAARAPRNADTHANYYTEPLDAATVVP